MLALIERIELDASLAQLPDVLWLFEDDIPKKRVTKLRSWGALELWHEKWDDSKYGGNGGLDVHVYTNRNGDMVDVKHRKRRTGLVRAIAKLGIDPEKSKSDHCVCSIGKSEVDGKWYGWSHRAMCGFGKGDMIFQERFGDDKTKFTKHGTKPIDTDADAKLAAKRFARSVS